MSTITFIGAGNIAQALIGGIIQSHPNAHIIASDPSIEQLDKLPPEIRREGNNVLAVKDADIIVLCVKPNLVKTVCENLQPLAQGRLFISVAAGITSTSMSEWLGEGTAIIRCMPNTPALIQAGMTGLFANKHVSHEQKTKAEEILGSVGQVQCFDQESELDIVTAISGSGPAYYFLFMEAMQKAGESMGLSPEIAKKLVLQTALGAAQMAQDSSLDTSQLRINVTSPGGTTEAALNSMQDSGIQNIIGNAIKAAHARSISLSKA